MDEAETKTKLATAQQEATVALDAIQSMPIATDDDIASVREISDEATRMAKELEAERVSATKPLNATLKKINSWFKPVIADLDKIKRVANSRLLQAQNQRKAEREAALAAIEAAGPAAQDALVVPTRAAQVDLPKGVGRVVFDIEITDAAEVPRWACSPDLSILRAEAKAAHKRGHRLTVPGVRITQKGSGT